MGNTKKFEIVITSPGSVFLPGQCIQGYVHVELTENMKMKAIYILYTSRAQVEWRVHKRMHYGNENYANLITTLYGNVSKDADEIILPAGDHKFPFIFTLPNTLPGSYEGEYECYVRHWLKAVMDRPWKFNKEYKMLFTVASVLDLNTIRDAGEPLQGVVSQKSCCIGCCHSGTVSAKFRINKRGFVPGESIVINGEVNDGANVGIVETLVTLVQVTVYYDHDQGVQHESTKEVRKLRHERVERGGSDVWTGTALAIPPIPPSFLGGCSIIDIQYFLEVKVSLSYSCEKLRFLIPVLIGTVPLYSTIQQSMERRQRNYQNSMNDNCSWPNIIIDQPQRSTTIPTTLSVENSPPTTPCDLPPPTYQECVFGKRNTMDKAENYTAGNLNFAPHYTYYENMGPDSVL